MIHDLVPYSTYTQESEAWHGPLPAGWQKKRLKFLFREVDKRSPAGTETHLSMSQKLGLVPSSQVQRTLISESYAGAKLCEPGDIVLNRLKAHLGVFARAKQPGVISPDYTVIRPRSELNTTYFEHVLKSPVCRGELRVRAKGIVEGFWRLYTDDLYDIRVPLPPPEEQAAIVKFLDHADRRIRRYIKAKQKLIKLLEEQKQVIIHNAVTKGLDPNAKMKPSGVEWLGEVPAHWEVMRLKQIAPDRCDGPFGSGLKSSHYSNHGIRVVRLQNIGSGHFKNTTSAYIPLGHYQQLGDHSVEGGDLLIAGLGDERNPAGRACVAPADIEPAMVKADCFRFRCRLELSVPQFLALQLSSTAETASKFLSRGATRIRINLQAMGGRFVAVPTAREQREIIDFLKLSTASPTSATEKAVQEIELLQEYRTRLIADVVTGKLDVREAAAKLPDLTPDHDPPEPDDDLTDDDPDADADTHADL